MIMKRIEYLDYLRAFAAFAVVLLHVSAVGFRQSSPYTPEWHAFNFYDSISRWGVPIFVMISGALFLNPDKEFNIKKLYKKNIVRIITSFFFWSTFYALTVSILIKHNTSIVYIGGRIICGESHLWFLYMILGIYVCIPLLRPITFNKLLVNYFLIIAFITTFIMPSLFELLYHLTGPYLSMIDVLHRAYNTIGLNIALGYSSYFVLGHYLNNSNCKYFYLGGVS